MGVVGDVHHSDLRRAAAPEIYLPYQQNSWNWGNFLIRTKGEPTALSNSFREQVRAGDRAVTVTGVRSLSDAISETVAQPRFYTFLFGIFGALGLLLTVTGVYGLISYTVAQRTQEIGIRMALGANPQNVVRTGLGAGNCAGHRRGRDWADCFICARPGDREFAVRDQTDRSLTFVVAALVLLGAALLASYVPARRATKVDPLIALRYE